MGSEISGSLPTLPEITLLFTPLSPDATVSLWESPLETTMDTIAATSFLQTVLKLSKLIKKKKKVTCP